MGDEFVRIGAGPAKGAGRAGQVIAMALPRRHPAGR
jgi:hypothetical protein